MASPSLLVDNKIDEVSVAPTRWSIQNCFAVENFKIRKLNTF